MTHWEFLEQDGRHALSVSGSENASQLVYDRHEILYVYGDDPITVRLLQSEGFEQGEIRIPEPHQHHSHAAFDPSVTALMSGVDWEWSPLQPGDDA